jgi:hypothetical protein
VATKESDWKVFTELKNKAIEKYCTKVLGEPQEVILAQKIIFIAGTFHYIHYFQIEISKWLYFLTGIVGQKH